MGSRTATVDIALRLNLGDLMSQINSLKGAFKNIGSDSNIGKDLKAQIQQALSAAENLQSELNSVKLGKVSSSTFTNTINDINSSIYTLQARTTALESAMTSLISGMSASDGSKFASMLEEIRSSMSDTISMATKTSDALQSVGDAVKKNGNINIIDTNGLAENKKRLEDYLDVLKEAANLDSELKADNKSKFESRSAEDNARRYRNLSGWLKNAYNDLSNMTELNDDFFKRLGQASRYADEFVGMYNQIYDDRSLKSYGGMSIDILEDISDKGSSRIEKIRSLVQKKVASINDEIATIGASTKTGGTTSPKTAIEVPINISETTASLTSRVSKAISAAQKIAQAHPIELELQFTSGWGTRKNRTLLKEFQQKVNELSDESQKADYQKMIDDVNKGFGNALDVQIDTSYLDKANEKVRGIIGEIKEQLNDKALKNFSVKLTKVDIDDGVKTSIQDSLKDIGKNLKIVIDDIELGDDVSVDKLQETVNAIKEIKAETGTLDVFKNLLGDSSEIKSITSSLSSMLEVLEKFTGIASTASLDKMFGGISDVTKAMGDFDLRTKEGKRSLQDIIDQYEKYIKAGGTKGIDELVDDKRIKSKLSNKYAKYVEDQKRLADEEKKTLQTQESNVGKNAELISSITSSLSAISADGKGFESLNKVINSLSGKGGDAKLQATVSGLEQIISMLNTPVSESGIMEAITKIADSEEKLQNLATVLKASKKSIEAAAKSTKEESGIFPHEDTFEKDQKILESGKQYLENYGKVLDMTLSRDKNGMTALVGKVFGENAQGQKFIREIKALTGDGSAFSREYLKEDTADLQKYLTKMQRISDFWDKRNKQGTEQEFLREDTDAETWKELTQFAKGYEDQIGRIVRITRQVREANGQKLESFSFFGEKGGHVTMGREKDIVATSQPYTNPQETAAAYDKLTGSINSYVRAKMEMAIDQGRKGDFGDTAAIQEMDAAIQKLASDTVEANTKLTTMSNVAQEAQNRFNDKLSGAYDNYFNDYVKKVEKQVNDAQATRANQRNAYTEEYNLQLTEIKQRLEEINTLRTAHAGGEIWDASELEAAARAMERISQLMPGLKDSSNILARTGEVDAELDKLRKMFNDNSLTGDLRAQVAGLIDQLEQVRVASDGAENGLSQLTKVELGKVKDDVKALNSEMYRSGQAGKGFWKQFSGAITSQSANFLAQYFSLQDFIRYGREIISTVTQIDSALIELQKVSDASDARISQSFEVSAQTAQDYGATISDIIRATSDWARLGYSVDEAEELARVTQLYRNVGDNISQQEASESLTATLKGFQLEATDAESIVDKFNEVANNFAIDTYGIGQALERSAASFYTSGTDLSKSIALVTTANTVLQNPETVGRHEIAHLYGNIYR